MATVVCFFTLLLLSIATTSVGGSGDGTNENVKKACIGTPFPETCVSSLSWFNESKVANASRLATMMVFATIRTISTAASVAGTQYIDHEDLSDEDVHCFNDCSKEMYSANKKLEAACGGGCLDIEHVKLAEVRTFLQEAKEKHAKLNCDRCRHGEMKKRVDEISKGNVSEKNMAILSALVDRVTK